MLRLNLRRVCHRRHDDDFQPELFGFNRQIHNRHITAGYGANDHYIARHGAGGFQRIGGKTGHRGVQTGTVAFTHGILYVQVVFELFVQQQAAAAVNQLAVDDVPGVVNVNACTVFDGIRNQLPGGDDGVSLRRADGFQQFVDGFMVPVKQHIKFSCLLSITGSYPI